MLQKKRNSKHEFSAIKEWFIIVENRQEGPYSILDLRKDSRFTPDTLVWKKGFKEWLAARHVAEIAEVFADELPVRPIQGSLNEKKIEADMGQESQATLTMQQDPYQLILWILVALLIVIYAFYQFFEQ